MKEVNKSISKVDGLELVLGKPAYTDDIAPSNSLIVKILRSPHAFARIKSINIDRALKLEGVECILTHKDVPQKLYTRAGQSYPEPSTHDKYILDEYVRYVGDEVAIIAAIDERVALKAMKLIKVEYEVFEPVLNFEESEGHPSIIHKKDRVKSNFNIGADFDKNIAATYDLTVGNVEDVMETCEVIVKGSYYSQAQAHAMMETYRAASYLDYQGRLVIISSTQIPFHVRRMISNSLEIPISKVRVIKPRIGGGFGGKQTAQVEFFCAVVTLKTGKPAKVIYTRRETFESTTTRHPMRIDVTIGADKTGKIRAIDMVGLSDTGAYGEHASTVFGAAGYKTLPLYNKVDAARFKGKVVYTNHTSGGALRGYGVTQGTFALESTINKLAIKLNIDPTVLREMNMLGGGETTPILNKTTKGAGEEPIIIDSCELEYCVKRGKELIKWDEKYPRHAVSESKVRGVGMAIAMQGSGIPGVDMASATIKLNDDGCFTLLIGATDIGTGSDTILSQIAAEVLGVTTESFSVYSSDTDLTPYDSGAYASSTTYVSGNAVKKAAESMKDMILEEAAKRLGLTKIDVEFDGKIIKSNKGGESILLSDLSTSLLYSHDQKQLIATGSFVGKKSSPPFMAGFAEVEVDTETGKVSLINYVGVIDSGTIINPKLARIQAEGGMVQGIGMALFEEVKYDVKGKLITNNLMEYKVPSRMDINNIMVDFAESYEPEGPFGAKSIGEVVINTPSPAIAAAVYNAVGIEINSLPITPEKVLMALKDKEKGTSS